MSFPALLAARAHDTGRAQPTALFRHRAIAPDPIGVVAWQVGTEPYSVGSIAIGRMSSGFAMSVPGYPLDRVLLFASLTGAAKAFCTALESYATGPCEEVEHYGQTLAVPLVLPQIVVANGETLALLARLGRRLAYLPTDGDNPADPALPRWGRHLMWLAEHAQFPGQQLVVCLTDLLGRHYATAASALEMRSLPALNAWIEPPADVHGFRAAEMAERTPIGPAPSPDDAQKIFALMKAVNEARKGSTDYDYVQKLAKPLRARYGDLTHTTWDLMRQVLDRERAKPEAASVGRRAREDRIAYAAHMNWMSGPSEGRRRTRMTPRRAAMRLHELENANTRLVAEEAIDDPLRMAPHLLVGKAVAGTVIECDANRRELVNGRRNRRVRVVLRTDEPCTLPLGTEVWWTRAAAEREWIVASAAAAGAGSHVALVLQTSVLPKSGLPAVGQRACFSLFNTRPGYELLLPAQTPWTHRTPAPPDTQPLDDANDAEAA